MKRTGCAKLSVKMFCAAIAAAVALSAWPMMSAPALAAADADEAQALVEKAQITFNSLMRDKEYSWLHENLAKAKGVLIYPQVLKAGFILGGSGGTGVLVMRDNDRKDWTDPAFYTLGSVTFGLQIGGEAAEVVMLVMTQKAIDTLFSTSMKLGADASIAAGPVGMGAKANIVADFISFAKSKGAYAGLNLEGAVLGVRDSLNKAYYGQDARPVDILVKRAVSNPGAKGLRDDLLKASK
jgi:lipid-binding SYLF domain-containing protein